MIRIKCVFAVLLLVVSAAVGASDLAKEKRWADQIVDALFEGEPVYLDDGRNEFLAIETPSADDSMAKAAVIMHGTGVHPDWPTVVSPLRTRLTQSGWHTLSIQMPVLANEAEHAAYAPIYDWVPPRIDAAVKYLRDKGAKTVVLIAHSQGSTMTAYHLSRAHAPVDGFVAIGMSDGISGGPMDTLAQLPAIKVPTLDLYGSEDLPEVVGSAAQRQGQAAKGSDYSQRKVDGADHFFDGEEKQLLEEVNTWLDKRY